MKKYKLHFKYIRNKQSAVMAVLNCIWDAVETSDSKLLPQSEDDRKQPFVDVVSMFKRIFEMEEHPVKTMSEEFAMASLKSANCFRRLDEYLAQITAMIHEQIVIEIDGQMCDYTIMSMVPDFDKAKVDIRILKEQ